MHGHFTMWLLNRNHELRRELDLMSRTVEEIATELADNKTKFDAFKAAAEAKIQADAAKIADLEAQLAAVPPPVNLDAVDAASADLTADIANTPLPA